MNNKKNYNQISGQKIQRIEALSDGIFAVALTLLVLDIKVPISESIKGEMDLILSLYHLAPKLLSYFLSFMTLGIFWTGHTTQFNYIEKSDRHLTWLSLFFLMLISLLPFTTAFLSEHIEYKFSIGIYWLNIFLLGFILLVHWIYAFKNNYLNVLGEEKAIVNNIIRNRIIMAQTLYALAALLCFINNILSIVVIILIQLQYALALFSKPQLK